MQTEDITHYDVHAEWITDEQGTAVFLNQEEHCVVIDPWQLRAICEQFGLIPASDAQAAKTITMLQRRMLVLRDRINELSDYLKHHSDHHHLDQPYALNYIRATADVANEYCADFDGAEPLAQKPRKNPVGFNQKPRATCRLP